MSNVSGSDKDLVLAQLREILDGATGSRRYECRLEAARLMDVIHGWSRHDATAIIGLEKRIAKLEKKVAGPEGKRKAGIKEATLELRQLSAEGASIGAQITGEALDRAFESAGGIDP